MAETFQCPQCGKNYPRENRLVGKAVACDCGRRFLVPPRDQPSAGSASASSLAVPIAPVARPAGSPPAAKPARAIPAARPAQAKPAQAKPAQAKPARWADPVPQDQAGVVPLTEADLLDEPGHPVAEPLYAALATPPLARPVLGDVAAEFPAQLASFGQPLPPARYKPPTPKAKKTTKKSASRDSAATLGIWVAGFVFFLSVLPACIVILIALVRYSKHGMFG